MEEPLRLRVITGEKFTCASCTDCCRKRLVPLRDDEVERLGRLNWMDKQFGNKSVIRKIGGKTYLEHGGDGACVFLNRGNRLCRIHEEFGELHKPLSCRVYPFKIVSTFENEISVCGSFSCPTIRENQGREFAERRPEFTLFAHELGETEKKFDPKSLSGFTREHMANAVGFIASHLSMYEQPEKQALFLLYVSEHLEKERSQLPTKDMFVKLLPELQDEIDADLRNRREYKLPGIRQMMFRSLLSLYLRHDEDVKTGKAKKLDRFLDGLMFTFGGGNFAELGVGHIEGSLDKAHLFEPWAADVKDAASQLLRRFVRVKLLSRQFMGHAYYGADFFRGLRSLAMLYPVAMAIAKYSAAASKRGVIEEEEEETQNDATQDARRKAARELAAMRTGRDPKVQAKTTKGKPRFTIQKLDYDYAVIVLDHVYGVSNALDSAKGKYYHSVLSTKQVFRKLVLNI